MKVRTTKLVSRKNESDQGGPRFFRFSCCLPGSSWILLTPFDAQQQPVFFYLFFPVSLMFDVLHTVINSVYVQTLPTEQATSVCNSFFRGFMTPSLLLVRPGL